MLDCHKPCLRKDRLWQIINELAVDKDVSPMRDNLLALETHLILLRVLDLRHLVHRVDAHPTAVSDDDVGVPSVVVVGADGADDDIVNPCGTLTSNGANR